MEDRKIRMGSSKMSEDDRVQGKGSSSSSSPSSLRSDASTSVASVTYSVAGNWTGRMRAGARSSGSPPPIPTPLLLLLPSAVFTLTFVLSVTSAAAAVDYPSGIGDGGPTVPRSSGAFVHHGWRFVPPPSSSSYRVSGVGRLGQDIGGTFANSAGARPHHRRGAPPGRRRMPGPPPLVVLRVVSPSSPSSSRRGVDGRPRGGGSARRGGATPPPRPPPFRVLSSVVVRDVPIPVLAHYLRETFVIPTDLPMPYERSVVASPSAAGTTEDGEEEAAGGITSWICTIYPDDTLLSAEIVAIRTDGDGHDDQIEGNSASSLERPSVSPPRMAMVAVKSYRPPGGGGGGGVGGSESLLDAAEGDVVRALERGLDDLQRRPELQRRLWDEVCREAAGAAEGGMGSSSNGVAAGGETTTDDGTRGSDGLRHGAASGRDGDGREERMEPTSMGRRSGACDGNGGGAAKAATAGSISTTAVAAGRRDVVVDVEGVTDDDDGVDNTFSSSSRAAPRRNVDVDVGDDRDDTPPPELTSSPEGREEEEEEEEEDGRELTSEELLREVLRFGDEEAERDRAGAGFARGAFDEARELLRHRRETPSDELRTAGLDYGYADDGDDEVASSRTSTPPSPDFLSRTSIDDAKAGGGGPVDPREELRRIFEAGRELAEGKITSSVGATGATSPLSRDNSENANHDVDVEALIASDKTVPGGARSVEDELAELEVRIGRDPDDERNGRPVFDLFSGPPAGEETIDPATTVNWPGAAAGTKEVKLHPELREAVDYAKFAAEMLSQLREKEEGGASRYYMGGREVPPSKVDKLRKCVREAVDVGIIDDPLEEMEERARLAMLLDELADQPEDRYEDIISGYKDLLLSDRFVSLVRDRLEAMTGRDGGKMNDSVESSSDAAPADGPSKDEKERRNLGKLVKSAMLLLKEAQQLGAELEAMQLETVRSICAVAMDPNHKTEEEAAVALSDAVREMRPLLDDNFVAYLKYAISEEEGRLARRGLVDDPDHNSWLFVLKIVQRGVYAELGRALRRHTDSLWYVLRMESKSERRLLLEKLVDDLPSLDVRPFRKVVDNIVSSLGAGVRGDFDTEVIGGMTKKLLQLASDIKEVLPPEKIEMKSKDADEWAAQQREKIQEMQQEKRQRLVTAREERAADGTMISGRGEIERI